jgi:hypothetical protein
VVAVIIAAVVVVLLLPTGKQDAETTPTPLIAEPGEPETAARPTPETTRPEKPEPETTPNPDEPPVLAAKPVIYLYPTQIQDVTVTLNLDADTLTTTYPRYYGGWTVTAEPDGSLLNHADGREYSYLFWEAETHEDWTFDDGFLVKSADAAGFLQEKLSYMGLLPKEYNEFIVYWLPILERNEYSLVRFAGEEYIARFPLEITPKPDSVLRVFMLVRAADGTEQLPQQELQTFARSGFAVVEWGGTEIQ